MECHSGPSIRACFYAYEMWGWGAQTFLTPTNQDADAGVAHLRRRGQPASPTPIAPQASKKDKERKKEGRKQRKTERKKERQSKRNKYRQADRQKERQKLITSRTKQSKNERQKGKHKELKKNNKLRIGRKGGRKKSFCLQMGGCAPPTPPLF